MILVYFTYGVIIGILAGECLEDEYPKTTTCISLLSVIALTNILFV